MEDIIKLLGGGFLGVIIKELIEYYKIKQTQKFKVSKNLSKVLAFCWRIWNSFGIWFTWVIVFTQK